MMKNKVASLMERVRSGDPSLRVIDIGSTNNDKASLDLLLRQKTNVLRKLRLLITHHETLHSLIYLRSNSLEVLKLSLELHPLSLRGFHSIVRNNTALRELELCNRLEPNRIGGARLIRVITETNLVKLNLVNIYIGDEGGLVLGQWLMQANTTLVSLRLKQSGMMEQGFTAIATALRSNSHLLSLVLDELSIPLRALLPFAKMLRKQTMQNLALLGQYISCKRNRAINIVEGSFFDAVGDSSTLRSLHFGFCFFSRKACRQLASALSRNKTLEELHLRMISFSSLGWQELVNLGFGHNETIKILSMKESNLPEANYSDENSPLGRLVRHNTLETLCVDELWRGRASGYSRIVQSMRHNTTTTKLSIHGYRDSRIDGPALEGMLRDNRTLKWLSLESQNLSNVAFRHLLDGLNHNDTLETLLLKGNPISPRLLHHFTCIIARNRSIRRLSLGLYESMKIRYKKFVRMVNDHPTLTSVELENDTTFCPSFLGKELLEAVSTNINLDIKFKSFQTSDEGKLERERKVRCYVEMNREGKRTLLLTHPYLLPDLLASSIDLGTRVDLVYENMSALVEAVQNRNIAKFMSL